MKKVSTILLCLLIAFSNFTVLAVDENIVITSQNIVNEKATISGKVNSLKSPMVTIIVIVSPIPDNGKTIDSATPTDLIYTNVTKANPDGTFKFEFPVYELRGIFKYSVTCNEFTGSSATNNIKYDPTGDSIIKSFKLANKVCSINGQNITLKVSSSTNITGMIADFEIQEDAKCYVAGELQKSGLTRNNFTSPVKYTVVADDNTTRDYIVTVTKEQSNDSGRPSSSGSGSFTAPIITPPTATEAPIPQKNNFSDVDSSHWAYNAISTLSEKKIVSGFSDNTFKPDNAIKREEFVKIAVEAFSLQAKGEVVFDDVNVTDWYYNYINIAFSNDMIKGISSSSFGVNQNITREDMATIIYRIITKNSIAITANKDKIIFNDQSEISDYAKDAVYKLQTAGIINGFSDGRFAPKDQATRAEVCAIISKLIK